MCYSYVVDIVVVAVVVVDAILPKRSCQHARAIRRGEVWGPLPWYPLFCNQPPFNDGARSLAIAHVAIVLGSTVEPLRGPDGCGIHVGHDNTAPDTVSKSEKARL